MSDEERAAMKALIDPYRTPAFMERLRANMARHKSLLDRLEALEHDEANQPRGPWRKSRG